MADEQKLYIQIAENTGVFTAPEMDILKEVIYNYINNPGKGYWLMHEEKDGRPVGFIIFGRAPLTKFSWDIYWLLVDKDYQGKGIGKRLLKRVEDYILQKESQALLRVETSTKKEFTHARNLYLKQGFKDSGQIPNFYQQGDDLITYYKDLKIVKE